MAYAAYTTINANEANGRTRSKWWRVLISLTGDEADLEDFGVATKDTGYEQKQAFQRLEARGKLWKVIGLNESITITGKCISDMNENLRALLHNKSVVDTASVPGRTIIPFGKPEVPKKYLIHCISEDENGKAEVLKVWKGQVFAESVADKGFDFAGLDFTIEATVDSTKTEVESLGRLEIEAAA